MPSIAEILQALIDSEKGLNPTKLAERTGVNQPTIQRILAGKSLDPETKTLKPLADYFRRSVAQLRGELPLALGVTAEPEPGKYLYPRAYENVVAGLGPGRFNDDYQVEVDGSIAVPRSKIEANGWHIERLKVVHTDGRSMEPVLRENEPVVVNLDDTKIISGRVYAIEDEDEGLRIKILSKQRDGRILVSSYNSDKFTYPDDYITPESRTRVVGRVCYRAGEM